MTIETILEQYSRRATCRQFSDRPVSPELIDRLLEAAAHAPTTGNMQLYSVVVSTASGDLERLAPLHSNQPAAAGCRAMLTFCVDFNRFKKWCEAGRADYGFDNFHSFLVGVIDTTIFAQQFVTLAEAAGLGTCYLGTATYSAAAIAEALGLPRRVVPVITIATGYPADGVELRPSDRLPVGAIRHAGQYNDYSPSDIARIYGPKEALPENLEFVRVNGKESLAQVYTDLRYTRADNERLSCLYAEFIDPEFGVEIREK